MAVENFVAGLLGFPGKRTIEIQAIEENGIPVPATCAHLAEEA